MKNWNPSRAPNAIAIRNLSKFSGRHYCRWLTKRGIGTISWVRSTDRKRTQSAREIRSTSFRFGCLIFHRFSSSSFSSLSWPFFIPGREIHHETRRNNRALSCFTQRRFTFLRPWEMVTGNGGGGAPSRIFSRIFFDSSLTSNFSSLVLWRFFFNMDEDEVFHKLFNLGDYVISFSKPRVRNL